jgi:hypothetical protein
MPIGNGNPGFLKTLSLSCRPRLLIKGLCFFGSSHADFTTDWEKKEKQDALNLWILWGQRLASIVSKLEWLSVLRDFDPPACKKMIARKKISYRSKDIADITLPRVSNVKTIQEKVDAIVENLPWRNDLLEGMLGSSILGFHTQVHCNNFLDSVDQFLEARIDKEQNAVVRYGRTTLVLESSQIRRFNRIAFLEPVDQPLTLFFARCCSMTFSRGGVINVVAITIITTAEKVASSITLRLFPAPAKIRPTSPRGIIPTPTLS